MYGFPMPIARTLAEERWSQLLRGAIPIRTMKGVANAVVTCLLDITRGLAEMHQPAAAEDLSNDSNDDCDVVAYRSRSRTNAFANQTPGLIFSSVVGARLPDNEAWSKAYLDNPECKLIMDMIRNPGLMVKKTLQWADSS